jgi:hypothetical protein
MNSVQALFCDIQMHRLNFKSNPIYKKVRLFLLLAICFFLIVGCKKKQLSLNDGLISPNPIFKEKITPEVQKAIDLSYNWQFDSALLEINNLKDKGQDPLLLDLLNVGTLFWQYIAAVTAEENNKAREAFSKVVGEIKLRTEEILEKDPENIKALYLLGFTEGSQSKFYAIEGDFFKAYRFGVKGYNRLKRVERINSVDFDTQFGIGLYKYYCATLLPKWFQNLSWMVPGIDVDREGGLHRIQMSCKYAYIMKVEADLALAQGNSSYEREFKTGEEISDKLTKRYPDNKVFSYTHNIAVYYLAIQERYEGKIEKSIKTFKKALKSCTHKTTFRMRLRKKVYLTADMRWKLDVPSEQEVIFSIYRELGKLYFYSKDFVQADQVLLEGAKTESLNKDLRAALYFEIGRQHRIADQKDFNGFILKAAEISGEGSEIAAHCKTFLSSSFVMPEVEKEIWKLQCKISEGKSNIKEILALKNRYDKPELANYLYSFYEIMFQVYVLNGEHALAEKYHDEVRYHAQLDR